MPSRATFQPLRRFPAEARRAVRVVFTDIDDTLTNRGRLGARAYGALEALQQAGILVVPITGRPAGWCDHIARMWPVDAVVGENCAFYFRYDRAARRMIRRFDQPDAVREENRRRLIAVKDRILAGVPGCAVASDQGYRETDLAIDFCEDVPPLPRAAVDRIVELFEEAGATAKISSIHVNGWFGNFDKLTMARRLMAGKTALREAEQRAAESHFARLREGRPESIETSAIHMDIVRDLKRINGHLASVAYPILEAAGELADTRLRPAEESGPNGAVMHGKTAAS